MTTTSTPTSTHAHAMDAATLRSVAERMARRGEHGAAKLARLLARLTEQAAPLPEIEAAAAVDTTVRRPDYAELDPGIRETVRQLNDAGFTTTDSGDGVSKPRAAFDDGDAIPYPHVVVSSSPLGLVHDAVAVHQLLGPEWDVEGTFIAENAASFLFLSRPLSLTETT